MVAGLIGAYVVFWFVNKVLMREKEEFDPAAFEMVGVLGTVTGSLRAGGTGEIIYLAKRYSARGSDPKRRRICDSVRCGGRCYAVSRRHSLCAPLGRVDPHVAVTWKFRTAEAAEQIPPEEGIQMEASLGIFVIAGLMVLTVMFLMAMFASLYRKAGPHEALGGVRLPRNQDYQRAWSCYFPGGGELQAALPRVDVV